MNAYGSAPTWNLTTAKRRIQEWEEAGKERITGESEENGRINIVMKTPSYGVGLNIHEHTHTSPLHLTVAIWRTALTGLQMWSEIGTLTRQSRLQRQHLKNKKM